MKRAVLLVMVVLAVLGAAVVAYAGPGKGKPAEGPPGQTLERQPTPQAVVDEHIDALNACDVDRLMAQYPESIHIVLPGPPETAVVEGREDVRALFENFCQDYPAGLKGLQFTPLWTEQVHKTVNAVWMATAPFLCEPYYGADAYETWSGLKFARRKA